jgi:hypothetical protein
MAKDLKVVLGKGKWGGSKKMKKTGKNAEKNAKNNGNETSGLLKKRSIFWNLPYGNDLMVGHAIDVMHVEKNVCEALIGTLLDIPSKTKDTLKACMDLEEMKLRKYPHHETLENGSEKLPTTCYTLSKQEKMSLCNSLHGIKVPTGYKDNVSRMVNVKTLKVHFKKSHDCHILMGQFHAIAIRCILPVKVQDTIMKLCSFFNATSRKVVDPMKLTKHQDDLILTMCNLETIFPPSFFDLMPHLLVHIVHEMKYLGPVFLH